MTTNQMLILQALIEANDPEAIPLLMDCLGSNNQDTVRFAASSIGNMATKMKDICNIAVAELVEALSSDNSQVRKCVLSTLMLLDVPLYYSGAITNVMRGDNQPYNQALAKKIIQNLINNDLSEYDNSSGLSSNCRGSTVIRKEDYDSSSEAAEPQKQFNEDMIENLQAKITDIPARYVDIPDFIKSDYLSEYLLVSSPGKPNPSYKVNTLEKNDKFGENGRNNDLSVDCDVINKTLFSPLNFEELLALDKPAEKISEELWKEWCQYINGSPLVKIKVNEIAKKYQLSWKNKDVNFSRYLSYSLHEITHFYGLDSKRIRTLILCVASLVLDSLPAEKSLIQERLLENEPSCSEKNGIAEINSFVHNELANLSDLRTNPAEVTNDSNLSSIIIAILRSRGLSNFMDIVTDFQNIVGNAYSAHSVGPMLSNRDEFVRFAPSIYGLREHLNGFGISTSNLLLNEYDCQLFIMARYAGENYEAFRLWSPAMEYKWYQWLENHPNAELRKSFYYIATPEEWPLSKKLIQGHKYKISQQADTYCFLREPKYTDSTLPDIRSIYLLIRYAKENGSINWISANRVLGRRIDDYHTAVDMAFLVCLGVVIPSYDNWQKLHHTKDDVLEIESKLSMMLHCGQGNTWSSLAGEYLIDTFTICINSDNMNWVDVSAVNKLFIFASKQNINLVSEENIIDESIEHDVEILPLLCNTDASDTSVPDENAESLLLALKVAMNPENLISDDLWFDWSLQLESHPIASQLIFDVANEIGLPWASTRKYESFDQYLWIPLQIIFKKLGWKNNRTFLICVANAVLSKLPKSEPANVINDNKPKSDEPIKKVGKITFEELCSTDNPINLISNEMWDEWTNLIINHAARNLYISDMVDELGPLFWQARWKSEKLLDYCLYSLDDIRNIPILGKNKTIIICIAKVAIDALSKLELSVNDDNELVQEYSLKKPVSLITDSVLIANEQPESNVDVVNTTFDKTGKPVEPIKVNCKPSFAELFISDNPIALISNEIWEEWTSFVIDHAAINIYISDMVDELSSLFWQAQWKNEKIFDYCLYSLDDIRNISILGKNRTIIICMAKVAIDALSKLELSANDDNELVQEYSLKKPVRLITDSVLIANEQPESNVDILLSTSVAGHTAEFSSHNEASTEKALNVPISSSNKSNSDLIALGDLKLDSVSHMVWRDAQKIELNPKEYSILLYMMQNPDKILSREEIIENALKCKLNGNSNLIDACITYLRKKVDDKHLVKLIHTVIGGGYIFSSTTSKEYASNADISMSEPSKHPTSEADTTDLYASYLRSKIERDFASKLTLHVHTEEHSLQNTDKLDCEDTLKSYVEYNKKEMIQPGIINLKTFSEPESTYNSSNHENYDELIILMDDDDTITLS